MLHAHESTRAAESGPVSQTEKSLLAKTTRRRVDELRPHSAYDQLGLRVPTYKLNAVIEQGEEAFLTPLAITSDGTIIDGYTRWEAARLQQRSTIECIEYELSEPEALYRLLLSHRPSPGDERHQYQRNSLGRSPERGFRSDPVRPHAGEI